VGYNRLSELLKFDAQLSWNVGALNLCPPIPHDPSLSKTPLQRTHECGEEVHRIDPARLGPRDALHRINSAFTCLHLRDVAPWQLQTLCKGSLRQPCLLPRLNQNGQQYALSATPQCLQTWRSCRMERREIGYGVIAPILGAMFRSPKSAKPLHPDQVQD
jgi:hypothetical protein